MTSSIVQLFFKKISLQICEKIKILRGPKHFCKNVIWNELKVNIFFFFNAFSKNFERGRDI
jgi:hypothetical protein